MADFDIDSVTRMLGREPDQEINGLHYEAVDRAAEASGLSSEELGRLADTPDIRDLVDQRREALRALNASSTASTSLRHRRQAILMRASA